MLRPDASSASAAGIRLQTARCTSTGVDSEWYERQANMESHDHIHVYSKRTRAHTHIHTHTLSFLAEQIPMVSDGGMREEGLMDLFTRLR